MTDEQAEELLRNNDWTKFSDACELLMEAAHMGAMAERKTLEAYRLLKEENEAWIMEIHQLTFQRDNLLAQRDLLLASLNSFMYEFGDKANSATVQKAREAFKAVEKNT